MTTKHFGYIIGFLLTCSAAFGAMGPTATQVRVDTNAFTTINGGSTLQTILDWMDDNGVFSGTSYLLKTDAATTYMALASNNTASAGTTNSLAYGVIRNGLSFDAAGTLIATANAITATNAATLVLAGSASLVTSQGAALNATNTVSLPNPAAAGQVYILVVSTASTNALGIASSGTMSGPAMNLHAGDMALFYSTSATKWVGIGQ